MRDCTTCLFQLNRFMTDRELWSKMYPMTIGRSVLWRNWNWVTSALRTYNRKFSFRSPVIMSPSVPVTVTGTTTRTDSAFNTGRPSTGS